MAGMVGAAVPRTGMFMSAVVVIVMIASHVRIEHEIASQQSLDRIVTGSLNSTE